MKKTMSIKKLIPSDGGKDLYRRFRSLLVPQEGKSVPNDMPTKKTTKKVAAKKAAPKKKAAVKKTAKKAAPKKTAKKTSSRTKSKASKKDLVYADNHTSFWVSDGQVLNSLVALRDALNEMEKEVYKYHATGDQNDFSVWVGDVLCDAECAAALTKAKTPSSAKTVVVRHLKLYAV